MYKLRLITLLIFSIFSLSLSAAPNLDISLNLDNDYIAGGDVYVTLDITNNGKGTQKILRWYTDLEEEGIFNVKLNGDAVRYQGPHYKRHAPVDNDYIKLKRGETFSQRIEMSGFYDMSKSGIYSIEYKVTSEQLFSTNKGQQKKAARLLDSLKSNSVALLMDGIANKNAQPKKGGGGKPPAGDDCIGTTCFTGRCSNGQKSELISALAAADSITNNSVAYLNSHSASNVGQRYNSWFGNATSSRFNTAKSNFNAINNAIDNEAITFDCSCKRNYFAYVYPNQPYKVYMCKAFWSANELGTDSRAGTIVHEISHFDVVAGTDDVVYGQSGARNLAISNPDAALTNADSHEYFSENTPSEN